MSIAAKSLAALHRNAFFAGLSLIAFLNGTFSRVAEGLKQRELLEFAFNTFDISAIVWIALAVGIAFLLRTPGEEMTRTDWQVALAGGIAMIVPVAPLSWIALSGIAAYVVHSSQAGSFARRGAWILLAVTIPMFWSRVLFSLFSGAILNFDAILVSLIVGTERIGNSIAFADGSGYLWIAPSCSSLANVSLAVLCFALFLQTHVTGPVLRYLGWAVAASVAVIAINVIRLSLIGLYSQEFDLLHGITGNTAVNWMTVAAIVGILAFGMRHDKLAIQ